MSSGNNPIAVLPNGNVQMSNGNVIDARMLDSASRPSQNVAPAVPSQIVGNGTGGASVMMSNGVVVSPNVLNSMPSVASAPPMAQHVAALTSNMAQMVANSPGATVMDKHKAFVSAAVAQKNLSNVSYAMGDVTSAKEHAGIAARHMEVASQLLEHAGGMREMFDPSVNAGSSANDCMIAPPLQQKAYCRPAPFTSQSGQPYFYVQEAYGQAS